MTAASRSDRARSRAVRLRREAGNCLTIAVASRDTPTAAALIDEAQRLTRRAQELAAGAGAG